jgi:subtilisin family serine protease
MKTLKKNIRMALAFTALGILFLAGCQKNILEEQKGEPPDISAQNAEESVPGEYIVVIKPEYLEKQNPSADKEATVIIAAEGILRKHAIEPAAAQKFYSEAIKGMEVRLNEKQAKQLSLDKAVSIVEPNKVYRIIEPVATKPGTDSHRPNHRSESTSTQVVPWGINRVGYANYSGRKAWVIDTGIDLKHEDLNVEPASCKGGSCSFVSSGSSSGKNNPSDDNGHGTHVAGTIGAINNSRGVVGVAAGARLVAIKVFGPDGRAMLSDILAGIDYVAKHAVNGDVVNMSFGGGASSTLDNATRALADRNLLVAVSAGNNASSAGNYSPARTGGYKTIYSVAAMRETFTWASFSNFGQPPVTHIAPGVNVLSTWPGNAYQSLNGTSMAAPHVAGILLYTNGAIDIDGSVLGPDGKNYSIAHTGISSFKLNLAYIETARFFGLYGK